MNNPGELPLFAVGIAIVLFGTWVVIPFVIVYQLSSIRVNASRILKHLDSMAAKLTAVEKNTKDVAKFFNEKDVRIEQ